MQKQNMITTVKRWRRFDLKQNVLLCQKCAKYLGTEQLVPLHCKGYKCYLATNGLQFEGSAGDFERQQISKCSNMLKIGLIRGFLGRE